MLLRMWIQYEIFSSYMVPMIGEYKHAVVLNLGFSKPLYSAKI